MSAPRQCHEIVTANRLADGAVVYLMADGGWSERFADAAVAPDEAAATALVAIGEAAVAAQRVVGLYRAEVGLDDGRPAPIDMKERIRARGPSIHPELGKQAEGKAA
jgi:Protein of unknown function (DUF2849)